MQIDPKLFWTVVKFAACLLAARAPYAHGQVLTQDMEVKRLPNIGAAWVTVNLENTYTNPIITCTYNLQSNANPSATTRIRNISGSSFQLRIQQFENSSTVTPGNVHCIIADEGVYDLPSGLKFEAHSVISDQTSGQNVPNNWNVVNLEEVTANVIQSYTAPLVLGQVMSFNDSNASVFWTNNCVSRRDPAYVGSNRICVGKHIGQINGTRASETLGYIVAETGSGTINDIAFELARGADTILGVGNNPPYNYNVSGDYDIGVLQQEAEDGGQGGWAILYGTDPLTNNTLAAAIEEEVVAGDTSRTHTTEQVAYWVFDDNQMPNISAAKTADISPISASPYSIPGSDIIYTISAQNTGSKPVDTDTVVIIDAIPPETTFYNGDIDDGGPETGVVAFSSNGSGLSFSDASDLGFSNAATKPANFNACTYTPVSGYDPAVTYICLNPKGQFNSGSFAISDFSVAFRVMVK